MPITHDIVSSKIYDKWDNSTFEIVNFSFLDGDVPPCPSFGVYEGHPINRENFLIMQEFVPLEHGKC